MNPNQPDRPQRASRLHRQWVAAVYADAKIDELLSEFPDVREPLRLAMAQIVTALGARGDESGAAPPTVGDLPAVPRSMRGAGFRWEQLAMLERVPFHRLTLSLGLAALARSTARLSSTQRDWFFEPLGLALAGRLNLTRDALTQDERWPPEIRRAVRGFYHSVSTGRRGPAILRTIGRSLLKTSLMRLPSKHRRALRRATSPLDRLRDAPEIACLHRGWQERIDALIDDAIDRRPIER